MRYPDMERLQAKQLAHWRCQECDRPCRQLGESAQDFSQRIASEPTLAVQFASRPTAFVMVTLKKSDRSYVAVCSACAIALVRPGEGVHQQRRLELLYGQLRLPGV
jgi:hypothetical protein